MDFERNIREVKDRLPQGLVSVDIGKDKTTFTIFFDTFLEEATNAMSSLWYNWSKSHPFVNLTEEEQCAQCMFQMMICKLRSIIKLHEGVDINIGSHTSHINDPSSMTIILRSVYELLSIFYYIFIKTESETERDILFLLWEIRGMSNRQNLPYVPDEFKQLEQQERLDILKDIKAVKELGKQLNMMNGAYRRLCKIADNITTTTCGFEFIKDNKGQIVEFKKISFGCEEHAKDIIGDKKYVSLYRMLSSYVHPSFIGVLQFGQMYNTKGAQDLEYTNFMLSSIIACRFTDYFCSVIKGAKESFNQLSEQQRNLLSMGNDMLPLK